MATFKKALWTDVDDSSLVPEGKDALLVAVLLWLRTYDRDSPQWLGLDSMLKLLVPHSVDLKLGLNVPQLPQDYIVSSRGDVAYAPGVINDMRFLWSSKSIHRELDLDLHCGFSINYSVHIKWIEWAMANAVLMLHKAGKPWHAGQCGQFAVTIGGMQVADFL